ncbi:MAG TPA: glycosyltransferase family 4 protein, partial [Acidobacteriaceae bacterium]|nr:glycosyltransferase family 4 protein [Acidobacteriaceae bacterium]
QESAQMGVPYRPEPDWFRERQLVEYEEADAILVPSRYSQRSFPPELQSKIFVAPLFGRVPNVRQLEALKDAPDRPFTFGTVGAQPLRKGFLYLLEAWEKLKLPNARLLLRTDASLEHFPALRVLIRRLPNVEITGYVQNMSDFYRRCDAFVFPTVDDGFGMALLEAMAHGLPSIATAHCGAAELFTPGQDLLIVPVQDAAALTDAMEQIYTSSPLRDRLRSYAFQTLQRIEDDGAYHLYSQVIDKLVNL